MLADFRQRARDRGVELTLVETAILRLYTMDLYKAWNNAMRGLDEAFQPDDHALADWATCICVLCAALVKLSHALPLDDHPIGAQG